MSDTRKKIEELAERVAEDALIGDTSPEAEGRREALKILNPHYAQLLKQKGRDSDDEDGVSFDNFKTDLERENNATVRSRTRRDA